MTDMHDEVVEAVLGYYDSNQDIAADCLLYLASLKDMRLAYAAIRELEVMERCPKCGSKLESYTHLIYHPEVDEPPYYEPVTEVYCPNCDISYREGTYVG